jgi:hypothetical protein
MNRVIAYELLTAELAVYRELAFSELRQLVGERSSRLVRGRDGVDYDLTVVVRWRLQEDGEIRVIGLIGEADWGSPHDSLDDTFVVQGPCKKSDDHQ